MWLVRDLEHLVDRLKRLLLRLVLDQILRNSRVLHIVQVINSRETFKLILYHLLVLRLLSKNSLEERLNICDNRCVHLVAFLRWKLPKGYLSPRKVIPWQCHFPLKFVNIDGVREFIEMWDDFEFRQVIRHYWIFLIINLKVVIIHGGSHNVN